MRSILIVLYFSLLFSPYPWDSFPQQVTSTEPYTSYFIGNKMDMVVKPTYGITMMGGRAEHDQAMKWFLKRANGGDVLVLRASGSDGYNNYLYTRLGIEVNSVESLVIKTEEAANHPYVIDRIQKAEAIWMAGGNQFNYVGIWGKTKMKEALNDHINKKKGVIGGTSAGMAVLGEWYFSAENGSINSEEILNNPFHEKAALDNDFLNIEILKHTITDTHYADRNRQGRHSAFMARIAQKSQSGVYGIACDEYTALCIGLDGIAHVYGKSPEKENAVYFIKTNCTSNYLPETLAAGQPITWTNGQAALAAYRIIADDSGKQTFNLNNWQNGRGGEWLNWYIEKGKWFETLSEKPNCN